MCKTWEEGEEDEAGGEIYKWRMERKRCSSASSLIRPRMELDVIMMPPSV